MFSMGVLLRPSTLLPVFAVLLLHASAQRTIKCRRWSSAQQNISNFDPEASLKIDLTPARSTFLQPNMDCAFVVVGLATSRWVITMDTVSLEAYQAQFVIQDSGRDGRQILAAEANRGTSYRQVGTRFGSFYMRLTTKTAPVASALGVKLTIEQLGPRNCPSGWYSPPDSTGHCYGVPKLVADLTFDDSIMGCNMMLANLVMGDSNHDSIAPYLQEATSLSILDSRQSYWVGLYDNDGEVRYLNKYKTLDTIASSLCSSSSSSCNCIAYQNGKFYRDDCRSRRLFVCYMPKGGTTTYYNQSTIVKATPQTVVIRYAAADRGSYNDMVVPIVLTAAVLLIAIVSTILSLVCCLKRRAAQRRNRQQSAVGDVSVAAATNEAPPPYPTALMGTAPPPGIMYSNLAFDANSGGVGINDKPPAYSAEWAPSN